MSINNKKVFKIFMWTVASFAAGILLFFVGVAIWMRWGYYDELNEIKADLNKMKGVTVVNIWGHDDITLEEISARIRIDGKGELVLLDLTKGGNMLPERVYIHEIGGYTFNSASCACYSGGLGVGSSIDIGSESYLGNLLGLKFTNTKMIIENYDQIYNVIDSISHSTNPLHIVSHDEERHLPTSEQFLFFEKKASTDQDPIFNLIGAEGAFASAAMLPWECDSCCKK
jgi:hypothetical protein